MHFGEMALLDDEHRTGTVIADEETDLFVMGRDHFKRLLDEDHDAGLKLLYSISRSLSARLRATNNVVLELDAD